MPMSEVSNTPSVPEIIRRRTPAERARYLEERLDELLQHEGAVPPAMAPLMLSLSLALADFAVIFEEGDMSLDL